MIKLAAHVAVIGAIALLPNTASAQAVKTHQVYSTCGIHYGDQNKTTQFTPIMEVTIPSLPRGSSTPNTAIIIDNTFREYVIARVRTC